MAAPIQAPVMPDCLLPHSRSAHSAQTTPIIAVSPTRPWSTLAERKMYSTPMTATPAMPPALDMQRSIRIGAGS